jgi:hypothetical protein
MDDLEKVKEYLLKRKAVNEAELKIKLGNDAYAAANEKQIRVDEDDFILEHIIRLQSGFPI